MFKKISKFPFFEISKIFIFLFNFEICKKFLFFQISEFSGIRSDTQFYNSGPVPLQAPLLIQTHK